MRLPTKDELLKLYKSKVKWMNKGCYASCVYWSSTEHIGEDSPDPYFVYMYKDGFVGYGSFLTDLKDVRCVRNGN